MQHSKTQQIGVVPEHYTSVTPWIVTSSTSEVIDFLTAAFGAQEIPNTRITSPEGVVIDATLQIGTARVKLFDARQDWAPSPALLNLYVEDVEKVYKNAIRLGARSVTNITPLWFGEKVCRILDPFGNLWWINQRIEAVDLTDPQEVAKRSSTNEAKKGIAYIQQSLDEAMKAQKEFFEKERVTYQV